jgi:hypothetical protein
MKTTIRFTKADRALLAKLQDSTGLRQSQIVRAGLRALFREIERTTLPAPPQLTPSPRVSLEQIVKELKPLTHPLQS